MRFESDKAYPQDEVGIYIEVTGPVTKIENTISGGLKVTVETVDGPVSAFANEVMARYIRQTAPKEATIRVYNWGGGFYPDDKVVGASAIQTRCFAPESHEEWPILKCSASEKCELKRDY